jgi:membrane fusion protein (multidrug efflux system)
MKNKLIIILILVAIVVSSCQQKGQQQAPPPPHLPIIEVEVKDITTFTEYPTQLEGIISSEIRAKVAGYITDVLVEEGAAVKKDQILFKLETRSLSGDASAARSRVNAAQIEVDKLKPLVEKEIVSKRQMETAKAGLEFAESDLQSIAANISYANIKSPADGYVGTINYREGALINPNDKQPLTQVVKINEVFAYFSVNEKDFLDMVSNLDIEPRSDKDLVSSFPEITLKLSNGTEYEIKGKITSISSQVNRETGTVRFRATFDNPKSILKDGLSGKIIIPNYLKEAVVVPRVSTFSRQGKELIYKFQKSDSTVIEKALDVIRADPYLVVTSGIKKGEMIIGTGVNKIKNGDKIIPETSKMDSIVNSFDKVFK